MSRDELRELESRIWKDSIDNNRDILDSYWITVNKLDHQFKDIVKRIKLPEQFILMDQAIKESPHE